MTFLSYRWARTISLVVAALLVVVTFSASAFAQTEKGRITGTVNDPNGAAVPGATVSAKSTTSRAERNL